tara:strand:+ start:3607 stop:4065 length:459 start_codon:yes stop_codon:yes gene_type:complete
MKKIKITIFLIILLILNNCSGYEPIFSKKNYDFSINEIEIIGDKSLGNKISDNLQAYKNKDNEKTLSLVINTGLKKDISSRDTKGNPKTFSIKITSEVKVINDEVEKLLKFTENTTYNNSSSKFELKKNESNIAEYLIEKISRNIINSLQTF